MLAGLLCFICYLLMEHTVTLPYRAYRVFMMDKPAGLSDATPLLFVYTHYVTIL